MNWSLLLYRIPKLRNKTWNWVAECKTKLWMNQKLKYNCNQHCINSIAAEFPTEIHCNFLSFSFNRKIVPIFRNWNLYANVGYNSGIKKLNVKLCEFWTLKTAELCAKTKMETEFNTRNRNVTLNWKCKTELCVEIHSSGIIKTWID